jgi:hypothetical protein
MQVNAAVLVDNDEALKFFIYKSTAGLSTEQTPNTETKFLAYKEHDKTKIFGKTYTHNYTIMKPLLLNQ